VHGVASCRGGGPGESQETGVLWWHDSATTKSPAGFEKRRRQKNARFNWNRGEMKSG